MMLVLTLNCVVILWSAIESDEETQNTLDYIDDIILNFYIGECIIKMIGLGISPKINIYIRVYIFKICYPFFESLYNSNH